MSFGANSHVWFNGHLAEWQATTVGIATHALHYGTGVFEGIRSYDTPEGPAIFRLDEHLDRLYASAAIYGMDIGFPKGELRDAVRAVVRTNGLKDCYIRPLVFLGDETLGVSGKPSVHTAVLAWEWKSARGPEAATRGVRATVSPWVKFHRSMIPAAAKASGQYVNSRLAVQEALARGFDEALLLNADGTIAEGAVENIFLVRDGAVITNDETSNILPGITRASILDLARDLGLPVHVRALRVPDLLAAQEAFFTGTAIEVLPMRELDGKAVGGGVRGPITEKLQQAFADAVRGRAAARREWLTPVARMER
jgi:branched-chain amino acid aminotransferase